jgi:hypothetical protein
MRFIVYRDSTYKDTLLPSPHPVDSPFIDMVVPDSLCTSAEFGTYRCRVDMELPVSVELPGDTIFWIEVQPINIYSLNGQTGWISAVGCGNGTGFYIRFSAIGIDEFTSAELYWGDSLEVAMVLRGDMLSGIPEDVEGDSEPLFLSVVQPTSGRALISYEINSSGPVTLEVYDIMGKKVRTLVDVENEIPGIKTVNWDCTNGNGASVVNGVYLIRLESNNKNATRKMILAR